MNIVVRVSPPDLEPLLGSKVTLTCFAVSLPASNYTWWREEGGRERLVEEGSGVMVRGGGGGRKGEAGGGVCVGGLVMKFMNT